MLIKIKQNRKWGYYNTETKYEIPCIYEDADNFENGYAGDDSYATIVCFLPKGEDLYKYWDDAYDVDSDEKDGITYTDRFPKPDWILTEKQKLLEYILIGKLIAIELYIVQIMVHQVVT